MPGNEPRSMGHAFQVTFRPFSNLSQILVQVWSSPFIARSLTLLSHKSRPVTTPNYNQLFD
jgi:hypothetical protein